MTRLYAQLEALESTDEQISVAIVGAGRMGRSLAVGSAHVNGLRVTAIADIEVERAREAFRELGYTEGEIALVESVPEGNEARANGQPVATPDALLPPQLADVDAVIGATGDPDVGATVALRAIEHGTHVVMLTDETDATVGPYLSTLAAQSGVVYSGAAGDEPGAIMELYDFAHSLGFSPFRSARSARLAGVASLSSGLFLPLPAATTSNPSECAKSYSSMIAPGSSPAAPL